MGQIALQLTQPKNIFSRQFTLILSALSLTVLIAVVSGLAIDTSKMFFVYDNLQNTTNSLAMNAASVVCSGADAEDAAIQAVALNPVVLSLQNVNITISNPPPAGTVNAGDFNFVYVELTGEKSNYLNQLTSGEALTVSATAAAGCS